MHFTNATLTRIAGGPARDDWDDGPTTGTAKWEGSQRAYYREKTERVTVDGTSDVTLSRTLYVDTPFAVSQAIDTDDTLVWSTDDGRTMTGRARIIAGAGMSGLPAAVDTTRLELIAE